MRCFNFIGTRARQPALHLAVDSARFALYLTK
jgi:hypothetical protein